MASQPLDDRRPATRPLAFDLERAFVVHLCTAGGTRRRRLAGQVEHLLSGDSTRFSSLRGLVAFFAAKTSDVLAPSTLAADDANRAALRRRNR